MHATSLRPGVQPKLDALRALYADKKIIVGRDKLDVVKGVLQKVIVLSHMVVSSLIDWLFLVLLSKCITSAPRV